MSGEILDAAELERRIGYTFRDRSLLHRALTHRSFSADHNERLEFLGDSVLDCVVGLALFLRDSHFSEGVLTRTRANFVCEGTLAEIGRRLEISRFLRMGSGEVKTGGAERPSIIADACEAVFGAVLLDGGFEEAKRVILDLYEPILAAGHVAPERFSKDAKSRLQELLQGEHLGLPEYVLESSSGAAHELQFVCSCAIPELGLKETGTGRSRRIAEQEAARIILEKAEKVLGREVQQ